MGLFGACGYTGRRVGRTHSTAKMEAATAKAAKGGSEVSITWVLAGARVGSGVVISCFV